MGELIGSGSVGEVCTVHCTLYIVHYTLIVNHINPTLYTVQS